VGALIGAGKHSISCVHTNYKEHKFDTSEREWSPLRDYAGSTVSQVIAYIQESYIQQQRCEYGHLLKLGLRKNL